MKWKVNPSKGGHVGSRCVYIYFFFSMSYHIISYIQLNMRVTIQPWGSFHWRVRMSMDGWNWTVGAWVRCSCRSYWQGDPTRWSKGASSIMKTENGPTSNQKVPRPQWLEETQGNLAIYSQTWISCVWASIFWFGEVSLILSTIIFVNQPFLLKRGTNETWKSVVLRRKWSHISGLIIWWWPNQLTVEIHANGLDLSKMVF